MKQDVFEDNLALYGTDLSHWPADYQQEARQFAATEAGRQLLQSYRQLDMMIQTARITEEKTNYAKSEDFLTSLKSIPRYYNQQSAKAQHSPSSSSLIDVFNTILEDLKQGLSPGVLVAQAACMAAALFLGIYVAGSPAEVSIKGVQGDDSIDISETLFAEMDYDNFLTDTLAEIDEEG